jgi:hypothetical protein
MLSTAKVVPDGLGVIGPIIISCYITTKLQQIWYAAFRTVNNPRYISSRDVFSSGSICSDESGTDKAIEMHTVSYRKNVLL